MQNMKLHLHNMYIGLVCTYWAQHDTKMGTAKQKALQQMQSFSKTIDEKNPMSREITNRVSEMSRDVSKQIMTDKSSELVLDEKLSKQYKSFGERQIAQSKERLNNMIQRAKKSAHLDMTPEQIKAKEAAIKEQDVRAKQNAAPYRALQTNAPKNAPKPVAPQKLTHEMMIHLFMQQRLREAA